MTKASDIVYDVQVSSPVTARAKTRRRMAHFRRVGGFRDRYLAAASRESRASRRRPTRHSARRNNRIVAGRRRGARIGRRGTSSLSIRSRPKTWRARRRHDSPVAGSRDGVARPAEQMHLRRRAVPGPGDRVRLTVREPFSTQPVDARKRSYRASRSNRLAWDDAHAGDSAGRDSRVPVL